jgi:DNA-binding transcriptional ArsR family regulator
MKGRDRRTGLGKALRRAVGYEELEEDEKYRERGRESILMNETRQRILQLLCDRPCSHLRLVSRTLDISTPTADWHLKKLIRYGFVSRQMVGKKKVYYPKDFVAAVDVPTFALLNEDLPRRIVQELLEKPGLSQKDLRGRIGKGALSRCLAQMRESGVLDTVTSGRFVHYYIDKALYARDKDYSKRMKQYKKNLLKKLERDALSPRIIKAREKSVEIEIQSGAEKRTLTIHTRPFAFMISKMK